MFFVTVPVRLVSGINLNTRNDELSRAMVSDDAASTFITDDGCSSSPVVLFFFPSLHFF